MNSQPPDAVKRAPEVLRQAPQPAGNLLASVAGCRQQPATAGGNEDRARCFAAEASGILAGRHATTAARLALTQPALPESIGPYRVLEWLGEGGMGHVYRAEQTSPRRDVAIKLSRTLSAGADTLRRFARETELLGTLEHPNIARLYSSGAIDSPLGSTPYLVMELVRGQPLNEATRGWSLRRKLALLATLARAVHYAHTRGVIHRDLKPANVLVTADGEPKVLDFGVARARAGSAVDEASQLTRIGEVVGTLAYMAWEQLNGLPGQADPQVDVYSLGAIAYELLSGVRPYPGLPTQSIAAALEMLRDQPPQPLASREPSCRGDLGTIVMKALARDPAQRYDSALALAGDLERYLDGRPIEARPPTARYVIGLFVRRHRTLAAAAAFSMLSLVAASVIATRAALAESRARTAAELRAAQLDASTRFLEDMLTSADPEHAQGRETTVRQLLDLARINLDGDAGMDPAVRALAARAIGMSYAQLGDTATGLRLLDEADAALNAAGTTLGDRYSRQKLALTRAQILVVMGQYQQSLDLLAPLLAGPVPDDELGLRQRLDAEQTALVGNGNLGHSRKALDMGLATAALAESRLGPTDKATLTSRLNVATMRYYMGQLAEARASFTALMPDIERGYGHDHPYTLIARQNQANTLRDGGDLQAATAQLRGVVADMGRVLGADHYTTLSARLALGRALAEDPAQRGEAEALVRAVHEQYRLQRGDSAQTTLSTAATLARLLADAGKREAAEAMYWQIIAVRDRMPGGDSSDRLGAYHDLARLYLETGQLARAEAQLATLVSRALASENLGPAHPATLAYQLSLGDVLLRQDRAAAARQLLDAAAARSLATLGPAHRRSVQLLEKLVAADQALGLAAELAADRRRLADAQAAEAAKRRAAAT